MNTARTRAIYKCTLCLRKSSIALNKIIVDSGSIEFVNIDEPVAMISSSGVKNPQLSCLPSTGETLSRVKSLFTEHILVLTATSLPSSFRLLLLLLVLYVDAETATSSSSVL